MFNPTLTLLGTFLENQTFDFTITYESTDLTNPLNPIVTPLDVVVTAIDEIPDTVIVEDNTISGFFFDSFANSLRYLNIDQEYIDTDRFNDIQNIDELIYYRASLVRIRTFSFLATASNNDTQIYTIDVRNDWTNGRNLVESTVEGTI